MSPEPRAPKISAEACPGAAASPSQAVTDGWGEPLKIWGIKYQEMPQNGGFNHQTWVKPRILICHNHHQKMIKIWEFSHQ
jgi:hypothetical protein